MAINSEDNRHITSRWLSAGTDEPRLMIAQACLDGCTTMADMRSQVRQQARRQTKQWLNHVWCPSSSDLTAQTRPVVAQKTKCFEFNIIYTQQGQPLAVHPDLGVRGVSVSHSGIWYAIATAARQTLGVDLQCYRHFGSSARQWAFTAEERTQSIPLLCAIWAVREAFLKSHGVGLPHLLQTIDIDWQQQRVSNLSANLDERMFGLFYGLYWVCAICYCPTKDCPEKNYPEENYPPRLDVTTLSTSVPVTMLSGRSA
ncbi:4'-phosphopantetheinyl transferase superfamily protein [Vibrio ruber]|uniref:4'-phosphopantetheinyl transferase family protein n=1 Tax=Vibrio ruber TaxID=184755 RepID=UPI0028931B56|nr:4'-phosphopantetheinyl transferase superfamily protein [Vibrio ruber]WNJ95178.1 4'-phosphopantetheinyl transferase superfamily protein [Vibrio ruber]